MRFALDGWTNELWNATRDLQHIDRFVDELRGQSRAVRGAVIAPPCDLGETESHYWLRLDMPGISKENIKIEVVSDQLVVTAERKLESSEGKGSQYLRERTHGTFYRAFTLSAPVDADKIEALYKDGVLSIALPKAESAKPRQIQVKDDSKGGLFDKLFGKTEEAKSLN